MSDWKLAMMIIAPMMLGPSRLRTWLAVFLSSIFALACACHPAAYLVIDIACGALVLKHPVGIAQRGIGLLFVGMAIIDLGYLLSPQLNGHLFVWVLQVLGWAQFSILAAWGVHDVGEYALRAVGVRWNRVAGAEGVR